MDRRERLRAIYRKRAFERDTRETKPAEDVREQTECFQLEKGAGVKYMYLFDSLSPLQKQMVREAPFNLCLACITGVPTDQREGKIASMIAQVKYLEKHKT